MALARWKIACGDCVQFQLELIDEGTTPFDLSGYTVGIEAKWGTSDNGCVMLDHGDLTINATAGTVEGEFSEDDTRKFPKRDFVRLNIELTSGGGHQQTFQFGTVEVSL